mgnify:CR=1 FL=1
MMKQEFEQLAGYEVSWETYTKVIEPMYMAVDLNKADFVKLIDKKAVALPTRRELINRMKKIALHCMEECEHRSMWKDEEELKKIAYDFAERFHGLDVNGTITDYVFFNREYTYYEIKRGCTFPYEVVMGSETRGDVERITLIDLDKYRY